MTARLQLRVAVISLTLLSAISARARSIDSVFLEANALYERSQYDSAIIRYGEIIDSHLLISDALFYNMANAYYRMKQYPQAILYYSKALKVNPRNKEAQFNLHLAKSFTIDKIEEPYTLPLAKWARTLYQLFSPRAWGWASIAALACTLMLFLLFRFTTSKVMWRLAGIGGILSLIITILAFWGGITAQKKANESEAAIIMQSVVSIKGSPDESAKDLFLLHAGTEVQIIERLGEWFEITLPNGHRGWIQATVLAEI